MGNCFGMNPEDDDVSLLQDLTDDRQLLHQSAHEAVAVSRHSQLFSGSIFSRSFYDEALFHTSL